MFNNTTITINSIVYTVVSDGVDTLVNLCPHKVDFVLGGEIVTIPPSGQLARRSQKTVRDGRTFMGIPISRSEYGEIQGLPAPMPHMGFIVSGLVKQGCPERGDVFAPSETLRNFEGQVAGATSLGI